jgi:hypothetical protein
MSSPEQFALKPVDKGCPAVATLFEPVRSTIMVRVYAKRIVAACAEWGADRLFIVNKFGVGVFTDSRKAWISGEPIGFDYRRENALRDALRAFAGSKIERFDRGDPVYTYGSAR